MTDRKVISLNAERTERQPHVRASMRCLICTHEWQQIAPEGTDMRLSECSHCRANTGMPQGLVYKEEAHLICGECENTLFRLGYEGPYCVICAAMPEGLGELVQEKRDTWDDE